MPDIQKLYDAKIIDIQDKHEKFLVSVLAQGQVFKLFISWLEVTHFAREAYLGTFQTMMIEPFLKIVNRWKYLIVFAKKLHHKNLSWH